ncbi:MAG: YHS domain protein [Rhodospirillales bacterium]|nr:YHS domain protein [Rhodospirillales bacterium]
MRRALCLVLLLLFAAPALAGPVNEKGGLAIKGYDPVAYFTEAKAVKGSPTHAYAWNGATWRFVSAEHRDAFAAAPDKYAPRYGGFCAYGVAHGYKVDIDPEAWSIVDGVLYLNYSQSVKRDWLEDTSGYIAKADEAWPGLAPK